MSESLRNPKEAAEFVWGFVEQQAHAYQLTDWDVTCFSMMWLAKMSQVPSYSYLEAAAVTAGRLLWTAYEQSTQSINSNPQQPSTPKPEGNGPKSLFEGSRVE